MIFPFVTQYQPSVPILTVKEIIIISFRTCEGARRKAVGKTELKIVQFLSIFVAVPN